MGRRRRGSTQENIYRVILDAEVEEGGFNDATSAFNEVIDAIKKLTAEAQEAQIKADIYANTIAEQARVERQLAQEQKQRSNFLARIAKEYGVAADAADDYGKRAKRARDEVEQFGDTATNISQISGALRGVGAGAAADVGMIGADIADAVEGIRRLGPAVTEVGQSAANVIPFISGAGAGLVTLGVAAAAVGGAIALVVKLFQDMKKAADDAEDAARQAELARLQGAERALAMLDQPDANRAELLRAAQEEEQRLFNLQAEAFESAQQTARDAIDRLQAIMPDLSEASRQVDLNGSGAVDTLEEFDRVMTILARSTQGTSEDNAQLIGTYEGAVEALETLNDKLQDNIAFQDGLSSMLALTSDATKEAGRSEADLAAERKATVAANELAIERAEQWADAQTQASESARDAALASLDARRNTANFIEELRQIADTSDEEEKLRAASAKRIDSLQDNFDKFATSTAKRIGKLTSDMQNNIAKAQQEFMRESVQANQRFLEQERTQQNQHNRERLRMLEDLNDDLLSAEEANDVVRFIQIQRAGEKNLRRLDEDADEEQKQRSREFIMEQKQRHGEYKRRLADIKRAGEQRIQAEREKLQERRALLAQQIADERSALIQQINDTRAAAVEQVRNRRAQYIQELILQNQYNAQRLAIEAQHQANLTQIIAQAQQKQAAFLASNLNTSFVKTVNKVPSTTSSFVKSASGGITYNIGSIGDGVNFTQVKQAITQAHIESRNAVRTGKILAGGGSVR